MTSKHPTSKVTALSAGAEKALKRAAKRARETARRFGTKIYVSRGGKVVAEQP